VRRERRYRRRGLLDRLVYLSLGLSAILAFIGGKLILTFLHDVNPDIPHVPITVSLAVILGILVVTTVASLLAVRRDPTRRAHAGSVRGHEHRQAAADTSPDARRRTG